MKKVFCFTLILQLLNFSCTKNTANNATTLALLQHNWGVVSVNGEALRYKGTPSDYFNFAPNNYLYRKINVVNDTSAYNLSSDGKVIFIYPISNGVKSTKSDDYGIDVITENQLNISAKLGYFSVIDSLKR